MTQPEQKRPQNCGTSYCSCIECVMESDYKALWEQMCERCDELDEKLAQPEREPVADINVRPSPHGGLGIASVLSHKLPVGSWLLYTTPPPVAEPHKRKPLTDKQIDNATRKQVDALLDHMYEYGTAAEGIDFRVRAIARAIEAAHGIKG